MHFPQTWVLGVLFHFLSNWGPLMSDREGEWEGKFFSLRTFISCVPTRHSRLVVASISCLSTPPLPLGAVSGDGEAASLLKDGAPPDLAEKTKSRVRGGPGRVGERGWGWGWMWGFKADEKGPCFLLFIYLSIYCFRCLWGNSRTGGFVTYLAEHWKKVKTRSPKQRDDLYFPVE